LDDCLQQNWPGDKSYECTPTSFGQVRENEVTHDEANICRRLMLSSPEMAVISNNSIHPGNSSRTINLISEAMRAHHSIKPIFMVEKVPRECKIYSKDAFVNNNEDTYACPSIGFAIKKLKR
jgi:hypothetical protein